MTDFSLRKASEKDKESIEQLFIEMLQSIYTNEEAVGYESGYLDRFFAGGDDWICAAEAENRVVGYISVEVHKAPELFVYLDDLYVSVQFRNSGIGSALIEEAAAFAGKINAKYIALHVESSNSQAIKLYERLGYSVHHADGTRLLMRYDIADA